MKKNRALICMLMMLVTALCAVYICRAEGSGEKYAYRLVWQEDFKGSTLDTTHWSVIERGPSAWQKFMSPHPSLFSLRRGYLRLYARQNKGVVPSDTASYLTGGICTQHKTTFTYGKVEVRARIHGATGCWPAIWIKSDNPKLWGYPERAEIDIMEYASHDDFVSQTVHNNYTDVLGKTKSPRHQVLPKTKVGEWNVYGVEICPDRVVLTINGEVKLDYPRIDTADEGQFPFGVESFLLVDMQVGNKYLKNIVASEYPAWMDVDWVKIYQLER